MLCCSCSKRRAVFEDLVCIYKINVFFAHKWISNISTGSCHKDERYFDICGGRKRPWSCVKDGLSLSNRGVILYQCTTTLISNVVIELPKEKACLSPLWATAVIYVHILGTTTYQIPPQKRHSSTKWYGWVQKSCTSCQYAWWWYPLIQPFLWKWSKEDTHCLLGSFP